MPAQLEPYLVYWPGAAMFLGLVSLVVAIVWFGKSQKNLKHALRAVAENRKALDAARAASKVMIGKERSRRKQIDALHAKARKLFWRAEKTWIG
jgi:hypothetical protein